VGGVRFCVCATTPVAGLVRGVYRSGDCKGGGSRGSGVVGSCGGVVRSLFRVSCGGSWRQLVILLE